MYINKIQNNKKLSKNSDVEKQIDQIISISKQNANKASEKLKQDISSTGINLNHISSVRTHYKVARKPDSLCHLAASLQRLMLFSLLSLLLWKLPGNR